MRVIAIAVGVSELNLPSGLILALNNCYCVPTFSRNIVSVSLLEKEGYKFSIHNSNFNIYRNKIYYASAPRICGM